MPRRETILTVFVASPGDVAEEREALESVIHELNRTWSKNLSLRLELLRWESDVHPGFGVDPQDVINRQVNDDYDIFIGIFWTRIGTETSRSASGTIEEFELALQRYKNNEDVEILLYFKNEAVSPSKIDLEQLTELMKFKSSIGEIGGLYWEFEKIEDFIASLRSHLSKVAIKWSNKEPEKALRNDNLPEAKLEDDPDEYGFFDYIETYENYMEEMTVALGNITDATSRVGENVSSRADAINSVVRNQPGASHRDVQKVVGLASGDLERYSDSLEGQVPIFSNSRSMALESLSNALVVYKDFDVNVDELNTLKNSLLEMNEGALSSYDGLKSFMMTIQSLPRMSAQFNRARKRVIKNLSLMIDELESTIGTSNSIVDSITEIIRG